MFNVSPFAPVGLPALFSGLLSDNKREVTFLIVFPPGQTISAVLRKQDAEDEGCSVHTLSRPYALNFRGHVINPGPGQFAGEFVRGGLFSPDGKGNFSAQTFANYNGQPFNPPIGTENFAGTYTVGSDCTVNITYVFNGITNTWTGAVTDNGKGVDLIVSSSNGASNPPGNIGTAITGTLQRQ